MAAPVNLTAPVISGTLRVGQTVAVSDGTWEGELNGVWAYQWYSSPSGDGGTWSVIDGASTASLRVTSDLEGGYLLCLVQAFGGGGSTTVESDHVGPVGAEIPNRIRVIERPPMSQYLLATVPSGRVHRWGEDEIEATDVTEGLTDSDSATGGERDLSCSLPRRPGVDYSDMQTGTKVQVFGAGNVLQREYRLERAPRTSGDHLVMDPSAMGYQVLLTDKEEAREIFLDADQGSWGEPSAERRKALGSSIGLDAAVSTGWQGSGDTPPGINIDFRRIQTTKGKEDRGEAWYDGTGIPLGSLLYHFVRQLGGGGSEWTTDGAFFKDDHTSAGAVAGTNHEANSNSSAYERIDATGDDFLFARFTSSRSETVGAGELTDLHIWEMVKVLGRHGLTLHGSWPELGLLASDIIAYALSRWAPSVRFTTGPYGTLRPSSALIPHLVFKEPTTVQEMITQALKLELLEWSVRGTPQGPTFFLNARGEREGRKRWRTRVRPAKLTETGQQMDQVWNRCVVSFSGFDGRQHTIGPAGSGAEFTSARCEDTDPLNPINLAGEDRTKHIALNDPATPEGAAEAAERFLERCKLLDGSGEATLTGYVEDEHGAEWPYSCVQGGDLIDFVDSSISGYRYIVEADRTRSGRSANIKIDAPPDSFEVLLEQLGARDMAAGLGS